MRFLALQGWQAALLATLVVAAVVALYLVRRHRRRAVVASLILWRRVLEEPRRRPLIERLRWLLSLLLALAIGLSMALAPGRPVVESLNGPARRVVVVLDTGPTMAARGEDGVTRWARARRVAERIVDSGNVGDRFLVADLGGRGSGGFVDRRRATERLGELARGRGVTAAASASLPAAADDADVVYLVTDGVAVDPDRLIRERVAPDPSDRPASPRRSGPPGGAGSASKGEVEGVPVVPVSVFAPAINVGISAFEVGRAGSSSSAEGGDGGEADAEQATKVAWIQVINGSQRAVGARLTLEGPGDRRRGAELELDAGSVEEVRFDLGGWPAGGVRVRVDAEGDGLSVDDVAYAYLTEAPRLEVLLVTAGNRFLETALGLDPAVRLQTLRPGRSGPAPASDGSAGAVGDGDGRVLSPRSEAALRERRADVLVLDGYAPASAPDRPALLLGPPEVEWLPRPVDEAVHLLGPTPAGGFGRLGAGAPHPLLEGVSLADLFVRRAAVVGVPAPGPATPLAGNGPRLTATGRADGEGPVRAVTVSDGVALLLTGEAAARWALLPFSLEDSNLAFLESFPVLLDNALAWLGGEPAPRHRRPGTVAVPLAEAVVTTYDGRSVPTIPFGEVTLFTAAEPGLYEARPDDTTGGPTARLAVSLLDASVSRVNRSGFVDAPGSADARLPEAGDGAPPGPGLWFHLLVAALLLAAFEAWTYHRGITL